MSGVVRVLGVRRVSGVVRVSGKQNLRTQQQTSHKFYWSELLHPTVGRHEGGEAQSGIWKAPLTSLLSHVVSAVAGVDSSVSHWPMVY